MPTVAKVMRKRKPVKKSSVKKGKATTTTRRKKKESVVDRISSIGFSEDDGIKLNVYGRSGTGKTTFWATFPKPILAIICSGSTENPGELRSINTPEYRKTVKQIAIREPHEVAEIVEHQRQEGAYKTIVMDHITGFQDLVLKDVLEIDELPEQGSWGMAKQQEWGQCSLQTKEYLRKLLDLDCNVVLVGQERDFNSERDGDEIIMPFVASALTPSTVGWVNHACDYICQTFIRQKCVEKKVKVGKRSVTKRVPVKGVEYCLRVAPDPVYTSKFRVPKGTVYPEAIVNPTFGDIQKLMNGG